MRNVHFGCAVDPNNQVITFENAQDLLLRLSNFIFVCPHCLPSTQLKNNSARAPIPNGPSSDLEDLMNIPNGSYITDFKIIKGGHNILSNFYRFRFTLFGKTFHSLEQAYQHIKAYRSGNRDLAELIMRTSSPAICKKLGGRVNLSWMYCESLMFFLLNEKVLQCPGFASALRATGDNCMLYHSTYPGDKSRWTTGLHWEDIDGHRRLLQKESTKGLYGNIFGCMLVMVRTDLDKFTDTPPVSPMPNRKLKMCIFCDNMNHSSKDCKFKNSGKRCNVCLSFGHLDYECSLLQNPLFRSYIYV
jgi:predicted NAD-dependent protein-ADP-ribosyltransferase YbiA (DUF1768 family)